LGQTHLPVSAKGRAKVKGSSVAVIPALVDPEMASAVVTAIGGAAAVMETGVAEAAVVTGKPISRYPWCRNMERLVARSDSAHGLKS
jgi:hypothetical protein